MQFSPWHLELFFDSLTNTSTLHQLTLNFKQYFYNQINRSSISVESLECIANLISQNYAIKEVGIILTKYDIFTNSSTNITIDCLKRFLSDSKEVLDKLDKLSLRHQGYHININYIDSLLISKKN